MTTTTEEYGVAFKREIKHNSDHTLAPIEPHRWGMTRSEAEQWIEEWIDDGGRADALTIVSRAIGPWLPETAREVTYA